MKRFVQASIFLALTSIGVRQALAQAGPLITIDEKGNGTFSGTILPSFIKTEPFSGITTLAYQLPFPGVPGDVALIEPNSPVPSEPSDVIRFDGAGHVYFFSDLHPDDGPPFDPADVGLPPPIAALQRISIAEVGPEGNNGAFYNPAGGLPGDNTAGATYHFISDVPEPTTLALAGISGLLLTIKRRRQRAFVAA